MKGFMDRVQRGGPWSGSKEVVHGPGVHVLYTSVHDLYTSSVLQGLRFRRS